MFLNIRYPVVVFASSYVGLMIGLSFKIMHWQGGSLIIGSMIMAQAIAMVWLVAALILKKTQK